MDELMQSRKLITKNIYMGSAFVDGFLINSGFNLNQFSEQFKLELLEKLKHPLVRHSITIEIVNNITEKTMV